MRRPLLALALAASLALPAAAQEGSKETAPTVRVCGLQVIGTGYGDPKDYRNHIRPLFQSKGTRMALMVEVPGKDRLLHFDKVASGIDKFADDKGTDLGTKTAGERASYKATKFYSFPKISKDGQAVMIDIMSPKLPADGAAKLSAEGSLVVWLGQEQKEFESKDFAFKVGSTLNAGKLTLSVSRMRKSGKGIEVTFEFQFPADWNPISTFEILGADGKAVKVRPYGSFHSSNSQKWSVTYKLGSMLEKGTVKTKIWTKFYEKKIPYKIETGFGLK